MTPVAALNQRVRDARRLRYIPDHRKDANWIEQILADYFETPNETEARGGADCDGISVWTIQRGYDLASDHRERPGDPIGDWRLVLGTVYQSGRWAGHAWVELIEPVVDVGRVGRGGRRMWADPTWGWPANEPGMLGFPATRKPSLGFRFDGLIYEGPIAYEELVS